MKIRLLVVLALVARFASLNAAPPQELPLEVFFDEPQASQVRLSPDGRYIALLAPANNRMQIVVIDRQTGTKRRITDMKEENVTHVRWANATRLLFRQQFRGQESFGIYAVNADGSNLRILQQATIKEGDRVVTGDRRQGFGIIDDLPDDPDHILIGAVRGNSGLIDVFRLNINNERRKPTVENFGKVRGWMADRRGVVRLAVSRDEKERTFAIYHRSTESSQWELLAERLSDAPGWNPVAFDGDGRSLIVESDEGRATTGLFRFDLTERRISETLISDAIYDAGGADLFYSEKKKKVVGARYDAERSRTVWFDADFHRLQSALDAALPGAENYITSFTKDETLFTVVSTSDRDPGAVYLYDAKANSLTLLVRNFPKIDPGQMAEMRPITFAARDGMQLYGYLTLPAGREPKQLPLIVNPHGGPFGPRDSWGFNPEVQFLANRGYAVLQVNFRGSGGYGRAYEEAGYRQWGLKMQDDLSDGVAWAIRQGYANPKRVAIYGASYGGYATMAGLVYTPDLYVCGVNYVGVVDISRLGVMLEFNGMSKPTQEFIARRFLHPHRDAEQIRATSPIHFVQNIRVPLLIAYGENDPRVTKDHGEVLAAALKKHGKTYQSIMIGNEGHGFRKFENRVGFYRALESFFAEHLGALRSNVEPGPLRVVEMPAKDGN